MSWIEYHQISERLASLAEVADREDRRDDAMDLYSRAAAAEDQALAKLDLSKTRTLGISVVSAASLHYKATSFARAEEIAVRWLGSDSLPIFARVQLRNLLKSILTEEAQEHAGVSNIRSNLLFQRITESSHLDAVNTLLGIPDPERVLICVAFMNHGGLSLVDASLARVAARTTILAGISNGVTSAQGLRLAVELDCSTYVVDTGLRSAIFHPKFFLSYNVHEARIIVGSANLTYGGLSSNIEAGLFLTLDRSSPDGRAFISDVENKVERMIAEYPENVFRVCDESQVRDLLDAGRVKDESVSPLREPSSSSSDSGVGSLSEMKLHPQRISRTLPEPFPSRNNEEEYSETVVEDDASSTLERWELVWRSRPLTRRDLNIPVGSSTNPTGSMSLSKGAMTEIDQRHYFRDQVFSNLVWERDETPSRRHIERAQAHFRLNVRNRDFGTFNLQLSHNTRTDTRAYQQKNSMTNLHWGVETREHVADEDLLGCTLVLCRNSEDPDFFLLKID